MRAAIIFLSFFCSSVSVSTATTCDIFAAGGTPCVAAHSTVRALYASFAGPLYQLKLSNGKTMDIKPVAPGGLADGKTHEAFCASGDSSSKCVFSIIYDQSENQNHLGTAPPGGAHHQADVNADAMQGAVMVGGVRVYGVRMDPPSGYRNDTGTAVARGDEAETIYAVLNGSHYNNRCCFDYGNAETNNLDDGAGTMEALYFGNAKGGLNHGGAGKGPWLMADMENALWGADKVVSNEAPITHDYVTGMIKGDVSKRTGGPGPVRTNIDYGGNDIAPCGFSGCVLEASASHADCLALCNSTNCVGVIFAPANCSGKSGPICWTKGAMAGSGTHASCRDAQSLGAIPGHWAIKGADATQGSFHVYWDGARAPGYAPMKKQGAIILGIGGDNSDGAVGTFYEGAMTRGYTSDTTDDKIQANVIAAAYGRASR